MVPAEVWRCLTDQRINPVSGWAGTQSGSAGGRGWVCQRCLQQYDGHCRHDKPVFFHVSTRDRRRAAANPNGYDLNEIDVISGAKDFRADIFPLDILVQPVGSNHFLSLSGGQSFSLITVPDGKGDGATTPIAGGSVQMAIVDNSGLPLARNIQAVELSVIDPSTWLRVCRQRNRQRCRIAGVSAAVADECSDDSGPQWSNGDVDAFKQCRRIHRVCRPSADQMASAGTVFGQTTFVDSTAVAGTHYVYEVIATGNGDSPISALSPQAIAAGAASASFYQCNTGLAPSLIPRCCLELITPAAPMLLAFRSVDSIPRVFDVHRRKDHDRWCGNLFFPDQFR